jgi:predicted hydrocarbon binding protein
VRVALHLEAGGRLAMPNTKGAVLLGPIKFLRKRREEALPLLAPELHHYLEERVQLSGWYPESDLVGLTRAVAKLVGGDEREAIERIGELGAREHATVYGDLIRSLSTSTVFALWSSQHDSGELRTVIEGPTASRIEIVDFDSSSDVHCWLVEGYTRGGLSANGLEDVRLEKLHCVMRGDALCSWRATWKGPEATPVTPGRRRTR